MAVGKVEYLVSAGGIVHRQVNGTLEVVLGGWAMPRIWGLPKGGPNPGERLRTTALREVSEETGLEVRITAKVGSIQYWFTRPDGVRCHKTVHHYLMVPLGGNLSRHDQEFEEVQWFPVEDAYQLLTYPEEVSILRKAVERAQRQAEGSRQASERP